MWAFPMCGAAPTRTPLLTARALFPMFTTSAAGTPPSRQVSPWLSYLLPSLHQYFISGLHYFFPKIRKSSPVFNLNFIKVFSGGSDGKESAFNAGNLGSIPGLGRSPGEGNGTQSSIRVWEIPWTEEPGG